MSPVPLSGVSAGWDQAPGRSAGPQGRGGAAECLRRSEESGVRQSHRRQQDRREKRRGRAGSAPPTEEDCGRRSARDHHR